ncbi:MULTISPECIES: hypothetical protein [unclassified Acinetobacter]|uniref:hypothetical protein n=1 Tax=unclassified Acinetobacter TaxID=196816 RepID=UPI0025756E09|nr:MULTISPECIES: hypothetical protein [unclassified Acinetobacter]MDM1762754.1 hypothetical protein [Acinetobacter sp. 226-1]MDM1766233.1 hypothetical protein [Acinetobacter sp. 226-4]
MLLKDQLDYLTLKKTLFTYTFEWIDHLEYLKICEKEVYGENYQFILDNFKACGWNSEGVLAEIWIPPFAIGYILKEPLDHGFNLYKNWTHGFILWHVKQVEDGIPYIASIKELEFLYYGLYDKNFNYDE